MKKIIYADNAATTKLNSTALDAMLPWLADEYGNASQPYSFAKKPKKVLAEARATIARCINASPDEIFFTCGGTESDNWAIKGIAFSNWWDKQAIITSSIEHHDILRACEAIERLGYPVAYLDATPSGIVTPESLEFMITDRTCLVSVMCVNNEIGTIQPIKELAKISHSHGALFHTDAVQAVGHLNVDVKAFGVDLLSASAHKFNGPKGVGFLYIKKGTIISPHTNGGSQEYGVRAGTENIASIVGMATALEFNCQRIQEHQLHLISLEASLLNSLTEANVDYIRNGDINHIPGNISLSFKGVEGELLLHRLDLKGICISTGSACDSESSQLSHVIKAIRVPEEYAHGSIRISLSKDNTEEEVIAIATAIKSVLNKH